MIYLDNAATTFRKPPEVYRAVLRAMESEGNASRGAYEAALGAAREIYRLRAGLAAYFGLKDPSHVAFTANATEALNIALFGLIGPGDHVISTDLEHNSVLRPLYALEAERNVSLDFVPADRLGRVDYEDFERLMKPNTRAIVVTHASNLTGNVTDLAKVGAIARKHGVLLIVDTAQTAGAFAINMPELGIDVACFTGHKGLMGPQGTGGLCFGDVEIRPWKRGGTGVHSYEKQQPEEYPTRLEAGTLNAHGLAGLSAALDFIAKTGPETIGARENALTRRFYDGVREIPGVTVYGDFSPGPRAAIVSLNIRDYDSAAVADALSETRGIAVRAGAHCAPRMHEALGTVAQGAVRFSFSWFNTEDEIDQAVSAVRELAEN